MGKQLAESRRGVARAGLWHYLAEHGSHIPEPEPSPIDGGSALLVHQPASSNPMATALVAPPFVGRGTEMGALLAALDMAGAGRGRLVLVTGEPGIGKSRLMEEFSHVALEFGWRVLLGRCWEGGGAPAYWPWMQVVQQAGGQFDRLAHGHEDLAAQTTRHLAPAGMATNDPAAVRFRLFDAVAEFLASVSQDQPLLVVLDDVHVADEPSLLLLRYLAEAVGRERILVLASYRDAERRVHELADAFGQLARVGHRISMRGLSSSDVGIYIEGVTGEAPPVSVVERIRDITAGNPFFLSEVVRTLLVEVGLTDDPDAVTDHRLPIPEEVRVLIRRRVAGLSREAGSTLRLAAVVGRDFDLNVLDHAGHLSAGKLRDVLAEAIVAGVIRQDPLNPSQYAFAHDLVRETLYEDAPAARRLERHRIIGRVLEEMYRDDLESHLAELAHHFTEAAPLGLAEEAVGYSIRAGDQAAAMLAYEGATWHYRRALQLLPLLDDGIVERRCEILLRLGDSQWRAGDTPGARDSFDECAEAAAHSGFAEALARAALGHVTGGGSARLGFGGIIVTGFPDGATGSRLLEQALVALPVGDSSLRAKVLARLATELYMTDQVERRTVLSDEAINMARRLNDQEALLVALHGRHWAAFLPDQVDVRRANASEMLRMATDQGDDEMAFMSHHARLHCCLELCDIEGMDAELAAMTRIAERIRQPFNLWTATVLRATRAILDGRLHEAERLARDALTIGRLRESEYVEHFFEHAQMVTIRWAQGRMNEVAERIRVHGEQYQLIARWRNAFLAAEVGDKAAARDELERHTANGFADLPRNGLWIIHLCSLAEVCVLLRDKKRAAQIYDLLLPYADRHAIAISSMPYGPVALRLGMIAALLERWKEAEEHLELAMERCRRLGARAISARVLYEHARMLAARRRDGDLTAAAARLQQAQRICRELDLRGILQRVTAFAQSVSNLQSVSPGDAPLAAFRREGEYWEVRYQDEVARLHDSKGLRYLASLLSAPGREIHAIELASVVGSTLAESTEPHAAALAVGDLHESHLDGRQALIDPQAREAYRRRLTELEEELQEARDWNDPERALRAEKKLMR